MKIIKDYDLQNITTFHLPAKCKYYATYSSEQELIDFLNSELAASGKIFHMGGGSNLVFTSDFDGMVLDSRIEYIKTVAENEETVILKVGAGVVWDDFVKYCVDHNLFGAENMSYIPGKVGASAVQNIGSYGAEVKDIISNVRAIEMATGKIKNFTNEECSYAYRDSIFKHECKNKFIVTEVEYTLSKTPHFNLEYGTLKNLPKAGLTLQKVRDEIIAIRCAKLPDPKHIGSVGSFFKNPIVENSDFEDFISKYPQAPHYLLPDGRVKIPAGWLIENAGLKGMRCGGAQVWEKQCLVIANVDNAKSSDVVKLYTKIISTVKNKYGIELSPEANIL